MLCSALLSSAQFCSQMSTFSLRNLTSTPVTLKLVERYKSAEHLHHTHIHASGVSKFSHNFTSLFNATTVSYPPPTVEALASSAEKFTTFEVNVHLLPFTTCVTDIQAPDAAGGEKVRLTFEGDDERYRI